MTVIEVRLFFIFFYIQSSRISQMPFYSHLFFIIFHRYIDINYILISVYDNLCHIIWRLILSN